MPVMPSSSAVSLQSSGSATFNSVMVNNYVASVQDAFQAFLLGLAAWFNLMPAYLQIDLSFGPGLTRQSEMTCEPIRQPLGVPPGGSPTSRTAVRMISQRLNTFVDNAKNRFQELVDRMCNREARLTLTLQVGDGNICTTSLRAKPHDNVPRATPTTLFDHFFRGLQPGAMPCASLSSSSDAMDDDDVDNNSEADKILFAPAPPGAVAAFVNRHFHWCISHLVVYH